jgi:isopenicillin N synthase-like dioxygenase
MHMEHSSLPIIDYAAIKGTPRSVARCWPSGQAARDIGFFYLVGHGLSEAAQRETLALAARFFALPLQRSWRCRWCTPPLSRLQPGGGRAHPGAAGSAGAVRHHERGAGPACGADREPWQRLIGPNQWPAALPEMKTRLLAWQDRLSDITLTLLAAFAEVLGSRPGCLTRAFAVPPIST